MVALAANVTFPSQQLIHWNKDGWIRGGQNTVTRILIRNVLCTRISGCHFHWWKRSWCVRCWGEARTPGYPHVTWRRSLCSRWTRLSLSVSTDEFIASFDLTLIGHPNKTWRIFPLSHAVFLLQMKGFWDRCGLLSRIPLFITGMDVLSLFVCKTFICSLEKNLATWLSQCFSQVDTEQFNFFLHLWPYNCPKARFRMSWCDVLFEIIYPLNRFVIHWNKKVTCICN